MPLFLCAAFTLLDFPQNGVFVHVFPDPRVRTGTLLFVGLLPLVFLCPLLWMLGIYLVVERNSPTHPSLVF